MAIPDLTIDEAWTMLEGDERAVLIDVRTKAEWQFVGVPNVAPLSREVRLVEWTRYPDGSSNPSFVADASAGLDPDQPVLMLCRSGVRSRAAGEALAAVGLNTFNVANGFEGDLDANGHRQGGWKHHLPWSQS
ncbi:MAG: rhodanese-like domain-containing protein [Acidimicrobiales bacterium]|nr:MAG: rhodanese-like domain-containing protein [Acidimicrobiales bacterium]